MENEDSNNLPPRIEKKCERLFRNLLMSSENVNVHKNSETLSGHSFQATATIPDTSTVKCSDVEENDSQIIELKTNVFTSAEACETSSFRSHWNTYSILQFADSCEDSINIKFEHKWQELNSLTSCDKPTPDISICWSLALCALTKKVETLDQAVALEKSIIELVNSATACEDAPLWNLAAPKLTELDGECYLKVYKLCQKFFPDNYIDIHSMDLLTICCSSLRNLSSFQNGSEQKFKYSDDSLKFILSMTGKGTREIVEENLVRDKSAALSLNATSHMVNQCLQILEHILSTEFNYRVKTFDHPDFSIRHCLTRLLGWCMTNHFQRESSEHHTNINNSLSSFYRSTLLSILKIFSVLSFDPEQFETFTNLKGLMEKVMLCILKSHFECEGNQTDVIVLGLELMINFFLKKRKLFVELCLKKFRINSSEQVHSIEALIKMLVYFLDEINRIKTKANEIVSLHDEAERMNNNGTGSEEHIQMALEGANDDMMLSVIVSFLSILVSFFMDTKQSFVAFIKEKLSSEKTWEAVIVSRKVLQFESITGVMPVTGVLLLRHAIKKLTDLHRTHELTDLHRTD